MDYEKKYNNIIDALQSLIDDVKKQGHIIIRIEDIENAIPDLKESEGEIVRKALMEMIYDTPDIECEKIYKISKEKCIIWLEKQGEKLQSKPALEVKEVDLEKELKCLIGNVGQCDRKLAKHFYELGLKSQKGVK